MTDLWYYSESGQSCGPVSLDALIRALSLEENAGRVLIWRHGFDDWRPAEDVSEVAQKLPPLPSPPAEVRGPAVTADDATEFKHVKPDPSGIGGWLGLVALGQVVGILRLIVSLAQYYASVKQEIWTRFALAMWGEAALNAGFVCLCIYTASLLFRHSRSFPGFFIAQEVWGVLVPLVDPLWVSFAISQAVHKPVVELLTIDPRQGGRVIVGAIGAAIWIPYILRSRRVANTFTK